MNWKAVGAFLAITGAVAALIGWWWAHRIHLQRQDCRLFGAGGDTCPSKLPAIVLSSAGGALIVLGLALLVGAASAASRPK